MILRPTACNRAKLLEIVRHRVDVFYTYVVLVLYCTYVKCATGEANGKYNNWDSSHIDAFLKCVSHLRPVFPFIP